MAKRRRRRKIKVFNLLVVITITLTFIVAIALTTTALYNSFFKHDYTVNQKDDLLDLPLNVVKSEYIKGDTFKSYEDDKYTSLLGIDVSSHQSDIDWKKVKDQGIEFAFIRCGYRGYEGGSLFKDKYFMKNYEGAKANGIKVGVYFFSQATSVKEAIDEAYFTKEMIEDLEIDLPVVYDLEDIDYAESRMKNTSKEERTAHAMAFASKISDFGYQPMIYTNLEWSKNYFELEQIYNYPIWYAQYNDEPDIEYYFDIWQYTDKAMIDGVDVPVDLNIMLMRK